MDDVAARRARQGSFRRRDVSALRFDEVAINLGCRNVLSAASFSIDAGEFVGVLGANGAGKTTLMRAALGLVPLSGGAIAVFGQRVERGNAGIGYMPQNRGSLATFRLTGYDIVAAGANGTKWGIPRLDASLRREIDWALDMVNAREISRRSLSEISGGERQRLLLSQALLGRPKLMLLDEPLISLDPTNQKGVVETVKQLRDELKITILFSAHEINPLLKAISRVLYLGAGKAVLGTVDDVITGPVLSRLYGSEIEVIRIGGRIFVMAGETDVERDPHRHEGGLDGDPPHRHGDGSSQDRRAHV
jgi:zinc/manganese transport system ATP-binding protein